MAINISGMPKGKVLAALYNNSKLQDMGFLSAKEGRMTESEADVLLKEQTYFDYLHGKVMKVDLSKDVLEERLYDRDNGSGAAQKAINSIK